MKYKEQREMAEGTGYRQANCGYRSLFSWVAVACRAQMRLKR
jgi:hypothetical protein